MIYFVEATQITTSSIEAQDETTAQPIEIPISSMWANFIEIVWRNSEEMGQGDYSSFKGLL